MSNNFLDFENIIERSLLCSPRLHLFDQKYSKNSNIVKYFSNYIKYILKCHLFL